MDAATTALQNQTIAQNGISQALTYIWGQYTSSTYTGPKTFQVLTGAGRLVSICVTSPGADTVTLYDTMSPTALPADSVLYVLPANAPQGMTNVGVEATDGIVAVIGNGVTVNITYSAAGRL